MRRFAWITLVFTLTASPVLAQSDSQTPQQSRAEMLRVAREQKAKQIQPYKPGGLEKWLIKIEDERMLESIFRTSNGFHVKIGAQHPGSGFAVGPGYKYRGLFGGQADFSASFVASMKKYWFAETRLDMPRLAGGRVFAQLFARRREMPSEDFFGLGPLSLRPNFTSWLYRDMTIGGELGVRPAWWMRLGTRVHHLSPDVGRGRDKVAPTIQDLFDDTQAPGLLEQPDFLHYSAFLDLDYAMPRGLNPRNGGRYQLSFGRYDDRQGDAFAFNRYDVDLRQYIPFLKERRVFALRALLSSSEPDSGLRVPFFLMPTLGGSGTLRGFRDYRFRDRALLLLQGEYRFEIVPALDMALFYDTGQVAERLEDLGLRERDYGFGFRFGTLTGVFLRIDAAFGSRGGKHLFIKFDNVF